MASGLIRSGFVLAKECTRRKVIEAVYGDVGVYAGSLGTDKDLLTLSPPAKIGLQAHYCLLFIWLHLLMFKHNMYDREAANGTKVSTT